ncbi:MAG: hypothetical protein GX477_05430 [Clostridiaceae bacterium]|nr:hypothetical protein [Clostridiaceae bacterium]
MDSGHGRESLTAGIADSGHGGTLTEVTRSLTAITRESRTTIMGKSRTAVRGIPDISGE